jgi:hypothetical protein
MLSMILDILRDNVRGSGTGTRKRGHNCELFSNRLLMKMKTRPNRGELVNAIGPWCLTYVIIRQLIKAVKFAVLAVQRSAPDNEKKYL